MGMLASDVRRDGSLTAAWDGATPATEPSNTCVTVNQPANGCVTFQLTGTWTATLTFEVSLGGTFVTVPATKLGAVPAQATTATTNGIYVIHAPGAVYLRARCSAFTSGPIVVIGIGSVTEFIPSAAGFASTGTMSTAGTLTNNNAAPAATNMGVLPAIANAAAPTWTEGRQVLLSTDLNGFQRGIIQGTVAGTTGSAVGVNPVMVGFLGTGSTNRYWTASNSVTNSAGDDIPGIGPLTYDTVNSKWNRMRDTNSADNSSGTGLAGAGLLGWDASVYRRILTDTSGRQIVIGAAATGAAVAGNPVLMAGSDGTNAQAVMIGTGASTRVQMMGITPGTSGSGDGLGVTGFTTLYGLTGVVNGLCNMPHVYNGTTADRLRSSQDVILHASAVTGTGTVNTDITTYNYNFLVIHANVTLYNAGTVLFKVQMQDANAVFVDIPLATTGAVASGADIFLTVGPAAWGANATPVFYANQVLPRTIRIVQTVGAASVTFSAAYCLKN